MNNIKVVLCEFSNFFFTIVAAYMKLITISIRVKGKALF